MSSPDAPAPSPPSALAPEVRDWFSQNFDQTIARQRSQADTAKLLVTFALAVTATVVATALQVEDTSWGWCLAAVIVLGLAFLGAILVILCDRIAEPDSAAVMVRAVRVPGSPQRVLDLLIKLEADTRLENQRVLWGIRLLAGFQLATSALAASIAALALLVAKA